MPAAIVLVLSLIYYPLFACADTRIRMVGHLLGFIYSLVWLATDQEVISCCFNMSRIFMHGLLQVTLLCVCVWIVRVIVASQSVCGSIDYDLWLT